MVIIWVSPLQHNDRSLSVPHDKFEYINHLHRMLFPGERATSWVHSSWQAIGRDVLSRLAMA